MTNPSGDDRQTGESERPTPTGLRCPLLDAQAIYEIANGQLCLNRPQAVVTGPSEVAGTVLPKPDASVTGPGPRQPDRHRFDAADIYELSLAAHPWQAGPIRKGATDGAAETPQTESVSKAG